MTKNQKKSNAPVKWVDAFSSVTNMQIKAADETISQAMRIKITFGVVSVTVITPPESTVRINVAEGQNALNRARERLFKPGVHLNVRRSVPLFSADPSDPEFLIRELNGKTQRGKFIDGQFAVVRESNKTKAAR